MHNLHNLHNIGRLGSNGGSLRKAYSFDGVNDFISANATMGRTGFDLNVAGNVTTSSDSDGSFFLVDGNRDGAAATGTRAEMIVTSSPALTQATSFTMKVRAKRSAFPVNNASGLYASNFDAGIHLSTTNIVFGLRGSTTVQVGYSTSINTLYDFYLVYDASDTKFYVYINGTLQNSGGTLGPTTFALNDTTIGDNAITGGTITSCPKNIYHACTWNIALTQAQITADINLGNTTKSDSTIVSYYVPENLQYNTQYVNQVAFSDASYIKGGNVSIVDGVSTIYGVTADEVTRTGVGSIASNRCDQLTTGLTGSLIASKTIIVKVRVRVASGTALFRIRCSHTGVSDYYSTNQTATVNNQEFTFTQVFTSSSAGIGVQVGIVCDTGDTAAVLIVSRDIDMRVVNQTLQCESPNIGGFIGRKTNKVFSCWYKPGADYPDTSTGGPIMIGPRAYLHDRNSNHIIQIRYENRISARVSVIPTLGVGFRDKIHIIACFFWNGTVFATKIYKNGILASTDLHGVDAPSIIQNSGNLWLGRFSSDYLTGLIRDPRIYTGTITDADALSIYQGSEPSTAIKYVNYKPTPSETGVTAIDHSGNARNGTLNNGVTRVTF